MIVDLLIISYGDNDYVGGFEVFKCIFFELMMLLFDNGCESGM